MTYLSELADMTTTCADRLEHEDHQPEMADVLRMQADTLRTMEALCRIETPFAWGTYLRSGFDRIRQEWAT